MSILDSLPKERLAREVRHYLYRHDFELFGKEQLKIRTKEGGEVVPFSPLRVSQQLYLASTQKQLKEEGFARQIWFKSRQPGGTTLASGMVHQKCVLNKNTNALIIAHDKPTAREIFVMQQTFHQHLHPSIRPMVKHDTIEGLVFDNPDSKESTSNAGLNSRIFIATAKNVHSGVGRTLHAAHLSEVARYENPEELQSAIFDAVPMKYRSLLIMESAAFYNPMSSWFKAMCDTVRKERRYSPWRFTFVGAQFDPDCALPLHENETLDYTSEEKEILKQPGVTPEFLKWRRYKVAEFAENGGIERFQQSYPVTYDEAWIIPGTNLLTSETLKELRTQVREPIFQGNVHAFDPSSGGWFSPEAEGPLQVWEWPEAGEAYDIAWDVCAGVGKTFTVGTVLRRRDKVPVAMWRNNTIAPGEPLVNVAKWLGLAYNTAQTAVESNPGNPGYYTNAELGKVYPNMFIEKNYSKVASKMLTKETGWDTTPNSKVFLISTMIDWLTSGKAVIRSETLWKELTTFRKYSDRHYEAIPGELDDCILPGQLVGTPSSQIPIEDVKVGSTVLSHAGRSRRVVKTLRKKWSGEIVSILPVGQQEPMIITEDHPVWSTRKRKTPLYQRSNGRVTTPLKHVPFTGTWRTAGRLQKGDYVFLPKRKDLAPSVYSDDVLWMMGWFLAEGSVSKKHPHLITFSLHKNERVVGERLLAILKAHDQDTAPWRVRGFTDKNGRVVRGFDKPNAKHQAVIRNHQSCENAIVLSYSSRYWSELLTRECGRVATGRCLSPRLFASNGLMPLVVGFFDGDGSQTYSAGHHHLTVSGIAHGLISQIRQILLDNGIWSTQHIAPARNGGQLQSLLHVTKSYFEKFVGSSKVHSVPSLNRHRIVHETQSGFWVPIKYITQNPYDGIVYNLEIDVDNSFVVHGMAVHNCVMSYAIALRASIDETFEGWGAPMLEKVSVAPPLDPAYYDRNWDRILRQNAARDGFERAMAEQEAWE